MPFGPETRKSLILQLRDPNDSAAWHEFLTIYRPVVFRLALARGLQEADAEDVTQQVLVSVADKIVDWEADESRARFRTWLDRVVRNAAINAVTRRRQDRGTGGTTAVRLINGKQAADCSDDQIFQLELRREYFRIAADEVQGHFDPSTWKAFWLTAVEEVPVAQAAEQTGKSVGAVYVARSRVMAKLKEYAERLSDLEREDVQ